MFDVYRTPLCRAFTRASTQYLQCAQSVFTANGPFSMACWFMSDDDANLQTLMSIQRTTSFERGFALMASGNLAGDPVSVRVSNGVPSSTNTTTGYTVGRLHHASCTHTTGAFPVSKVYIDGGSMASATTTFVSSNDLNAFCIGRGIASAAGQNHMSGKIIWPCIWNITLSDHDVHRLSTGEYPLDVHPEAIVAFWEWSGRGLEVNIGNNQATYALTNNGSRPVTEPLALRRLVRNRRFIPVPPSGHGSPLVNGGIVNRGLVNGGLVL